VDPKHRVKLLGFEKCSISRSYREAQENDSRRNQLDQDVKNNDQSENAFFKLEDEILKVRGREKKKEKEDKPASAKASKFVKSQSSRQGMTFQVKTPTGKTLTVSFFKNSLVEDIMRQITKQEGIPADQMALVFNGQRLDPKKTLLFYGIGPGVTINLLLRGACKFQKMLNLTFPSDSFKK